MTELRVLDDLEGVTHVAISGPLDLDGVNAIQRRFIIQTAVRRHPTIVEIAEVPSISSLGIGMLVEGARGLRLHGMRLVLVAPTPFVTELLVRTHVTELLPIVKTLDEAKALLASNR